MKSKVNVEEVKGKLKEVMIEIKKLDSKNLPASLVPSLLETSTAIREATAGASIDFNA